MRTDPSFGEGELLEDTIAVIGEVSGVSGAIGTAVAIANGDLSGVVTGAAEVVVGKVKVGAKIAKYAGGAFGDLVGSFKVHRHHMPANASSPIKRVDGPAIEMDAVDHRRTTSYGSSSDAKQYREETRQMIATGATRDAMARDIRDVRSIAGSKYNAAIREMLDYTNDIGWLKK